VTDIAGERRKLADQGLDIVRRDAWGARESYASDRACEVPARALFLHISVTTLRADEAAGMREIEAIGQARFGVGISYNAASFPSGRLYEGQPLTRRGAHTLNNFERSTCPTHGGSLTAPSWNNNVNARALVLPQDVDDPVTDDQVDAAARWAAAQIRSGLVVQGARWHGHRCVTAKDCPGSDGYHRIPELQQLTDHYVAVGLTPPPPPPEDTMPNLPFVGVAANQTVAYLVTSAGKRRIPSTTLRDQLIQYLDCESFTNMPSGVLNMFPTLGLDAANVAVDAATQNSGKLDAIAAQLTALAADVADDATAAKLAELSTAVAAVAVEVDDDATSDEVADLRALVEATHPPETP